MDPVLVVQHIACESPGLIEDSLQARNFPTQIIHAYAGEAVPRQIGSSPALVVMGGPMNVYEENKYPFLLDEIKLIESALHAKRPILGVCLGSQLLARALGAPVTQGPKKEIGWHAVRFTEEAADDRLLSKVGGCMAFHWHGDIFLLPKASVSLASSDQTSIQAYRHGKNAYGFLFHAEVTKPMIHSWMKEFSSELTEAGIDPQILLQETERYISGLNAIGRKIFNQWVGLLGRG